MENFNFMNYQLLIGYYSFGTTLFSKEIELLDFHKPPKIGKTKIVKVHDLLLEKGLVIG